MSRRKKISTAQVERSLIDDANNVDAWEAPIAVAPSKSPRPESYGRTNIIVLDADVAQVFPDSKSVNQALRALADIIQNQAQKTGST